MTPSCGYQGCTFDTTAICVLGNDPEACPHRIGLESGDEGSAIAAVGAPNDEDSIIADLAVDVGAPTLQAPPSTRTALPLARELGFGHLGEIGSKSGYRMIGILGAPDAGKTFALVSLYLLAAHQKLQRFHFRNSRSIFAFDEIAAGTRQWDENGQALEKITEHTELADERRPGFLHLRLQSDELQRTEDFVFPDLPGEWTDNLIDKSDAERLSFMRFADALWIFVDGTALVDPLRRQNAVNRVQLTLSRIRRYLDPAPEVPLLLVVTRFDQIEDLPADPIERIMKEAANRKIDLKVIEVSSFSEREGIESGHGLEALLSASIPRPIASLLTSSAILASAGRQMLLHRV